MIQDNRQYGVLYSSWVVVILKLFNLVFKVNRHTRYRLRQITLPIRLLVGFVIVADAIGRPFYRPLLNWIASWRFMEAFEAIVAGLPRLAILILFAVPFAFAEPLKVFALILLASGKVVIGLPLLIFSYLVTFLLVERIYHAGKWKLLTYRWFAWAMGHIGQIRDRLIAFRTDALASVLKMLSKIGY
jgi:hypothetical protein